jgi:hypothetical protein
MKDYRIGGVEQAGDHPDDHEDDNRGSDQSDEVLAVRRERLV